MAGSIAYLIVALTRMYETSTKIMLDDKQASIFELGGDLNQVALHYGGLDLVSDQTELAKSQTLLKRAINIAFKSSKPPEIHFLMKNLTR
ncbi:hypothetical protein [Richelia intracellularis]|uniref:hypothetical protein n=1 Tax=Richelia intracellularis TaxID=1164990 RepID=UPI0005C4ED96|nr:hypothetical protein [Richelia intracellularis]